jgi:hypothetical protein
MKSLSPPCEPYEGPMVRAGRIVLLTVLGAMLFAASASGQSADQKRASVDLYWLGPFFAGLPVTEGREVPVPEFAYGECIPEGGSACPWPASVVTSTTCARL